MAHLQVMSSNLPVTPMMVYGTGRWAHINVKLHFFCDLKTIFSCFTGRFPVGKSDKSCQNQLKHQNCQKIAPWSPTRCAAAVATALFSPSSRHLLATLTRKKSYLRNRLTYGRHILYVIRVIRGKVKGQGSKVKVSIPVINVKEKACGSHQRQIALLGQCKARPFNFHRVYLFVSFFVSVPQHIMVLALSCLNRWT